MTDLINDFSSLNIDAIFKMGDLDKPTQNHLLKVYSIICTGVITSLLSGYLFFLQILNPAIFAILGIAILVANILVCFKGDKNNKISAFIFYATATILGGIIGFFFTTIDDSEEMIEISKITLTAGSYSILLFAIFSIFTIVSKQRLTIFFGSAVVCLILGLISLFVFNIIAEALIGVLIGCLYVIVDTQIIIYKSQSGVHQPFTDALNLFTDLFKIFVEILKLLGAKKKKNDK